LPPPAPPAAKPAAVPAKAAKPVAPETAWRPENYVVKKGDTLHGIGLEFGFDYKDIAEWNSIQPPYVIRIGQELRLKGSKTAAPNTEQTPEGAVTAPLAGEPAASVKPLADQTQTISAKAGDETPLLSEPKANKQRYSDKAMAAAMARSANPGSDKASAKTDTEAAKTDIPGDKAAPPDKSEINWSWPATGKILSGFNATASGKGLDIGGTPGQPVYAAASGKVTYTGASVRGYGKLVIIKHNETYLSVYSHNSQVLVKEGQDVAKGQKIAEMGSTDTDRVKLHFEIRKLGKPVDPAKYLPAASNE
jgi:lipoprotein NlpD